MRYKGVTPRDVPTYGNHCDTATIVSANRQQSGASSALSASIGRRTVNCSFIVFTASHAPCVRSVPAKSTSTFPPFISVAGQTVGTTSAPNTIAMSNIDLQSETNPLNRPRPFVYELIFQLNTLYQHSNVRAGDRLEQRPNFVVVTPWTASIIKTVPKDERKLVFCVFAVEAARYDALRCTAVGHRHRGTLAATTLARRFSSCRSAGRWRLLAWTAVLCCARNAQRLRAVTSVHTASIRIPVSTRRRT